MPRTLKWLGELLAVQLLMAVGLHLPALYPVTQPVAAPLVELEQNQINHIVLEEPGQNKVVFVKERGTWLLSDLGNFPADSNRVNTMLEKITSSKTGPPIATTTGAKARFRVSDDAFERRITLADNDKTLATLYVGSSPGLRRSYVRAGGEDAIFALELAAYDVPMSLADWEDKTVLHLSKNDITALEIAGLRIEQAVQPASSPSSMQADNQPHPAVTPQTWEAKGLEGGRRLELKSEAVDKLTQVLADLTFEKVLGRDLSPEYGLEKPLLTITLSRKAGDTLTYHLGKNPKNDDYTLKVSNRPEYFRVASYRATALLDAADHKQLLNTAPGTPTPTKS